MGITTNFSSYQEATTFLFQAVDFEKLTKYKYDIPNFNLDRMERLLASVGNPHKGLKAVHIAGTKGKGSTAIIIASILKELGLCTGLFTSPHLVHLEERICINGEMISRDEVCRLLGELRPYIEEERRFNQKLSPTFFEIITALAFLYFKRKNVDIAVLEVGMGGRLDSTNVVHPNVSVITNIGFDHTDKLGTTLSQIAFEKAGIIKEGIPVVSSEQYPEALTIIEKTCKERNSELLILGRDIKILNSSPLTMGAFNGIKCNIKTHTHSYKNLFLPLLGEHQLSNCAVALGAIDVLSEQGLIKIHEGCVRHALTTVRCLARVEVVSRKPLIILDAAHTVESIKALKQALQSNFKFNKLIVLMGISKD
ncbi:MAG: bifunctional folylpolyglutamate synthase/dihydrofolate synthase, partial [Planctomycetes bacterium]|nr:bifunctional folylpolyglutamate synthase/dihydrofolate synthase [Planctomycetota bacterium]